jgi:hypothetical protein
MNHTILNVNKDQPKKPDKMPKDNEKNPQKDKK